jgi:hypothetical protein
MIVRIWQGIVLSSNAAKYQALLQEKVLPIYQHADGNLGTYLCHEFHDQLVNFLLLSLWSSHEALIHFTGPDMEVIAPSIEEKKLLLAFESMARNYEVSQLYEPRKAGDSREGN